MKKILIRFPDFIRRLWCQLAISYTVLAFCAMLLLVILLYGINDYHDYHAALTLDHVKQRVASEKLTVALAIQEGGSAEWLAKARDSLREKLTNLEHGSGTTSIYRITNSSCPEVYLRVTDSQGNLLMYDPADPPKKISDEFASRKAQPDQIRVVWLAQEKGPIWVDMPITAADNRMVGRLSVLYVAEFNLWVQVRSIADFLLNSWSLVFFLCLPIGIACGLVASRYVTRQLQKMNEVTESWRKGNFEARIALPSDDVLLRHSQYLNDMAQDLEKYLSLKQHLAISEERNRVARELHDTVKQKLFALGLQLATAKTKPAVMEAARDHILEAETITREAQYDLMEIITQLHPSQTDEASLRDRISLLADDFRRRFEVRIELQFPDTFQCSSTCEHQVLRIVQESLINAIRHGKAAKIRIACTVEQDQILLTITDEGLGFDTTQKTGGFGLVSMRDRVQDLPSGTFELTSTPGAGTQIKLTWKNN